MRLNAKTRKATFLASLNKTGHNNPVNDLSEQEGRISAIYGQYGTGLNIIQEMGFNSNPQNFQCFTQDLIEKRNYVENVINRMYKSTDSIIDEVANNLRYE